MGGSWKAILEGLGVVGGRGERERKRGDGVANVWRAVFMFELRFAEPALVCRASRFARPQR